MQMRVPSRLQNRGEAAPLHPKDQLSNEDAEANECSELVLLEEDARVSFTTSLGLETCSLDSIQFV